MRGMDEHGLVRPDIVPEAGSAAAWETQRLDAGSADLAEFEVAIVGSERDRKPSVAGEELDIRRACRICRLTALIQRKLRIVKAA